MLNRSNITLAAALVAQVVLLAISVGARTGSEGAAAQPLLTGFQPADVTQMVIVDDLDNVVTIARSDEGWALPEADDFPVNGDKAEELLTGIAGLDTSRLVASNPANFARLEVAEKDFRRKLSLTRGDETSALYLGGSAGADTVYARLHGENRAYLGKDLSAWDAATQVSAWIDTSYVNVPQADVMRIKVSNANGNFEFERADETWRYLGLPAGETFEDTLLPGILRNAASIRMVEPLGRDLLDEYSLDAPAVTVEVVYQQIVETEAESADDERDLADESDDEMSGNDVESGKDESGNEESENEEDETAASEELITYRTESYTLSFGARQADDNIVMKASTSEYYVTVREYALEAFSDLAQADLVRSAEAAADAAADG